MRTKKLLAGLILLLGIISNASAERILLLRDVGGSGWVDSLSKYGHTVTVATTTPTSLSTANYDQFWIANHGGGTGGNGEPTASTISLMLPFLQGGGKIALFCDHSAGGAWASAVQTQTGIETFINTVKLPSASLFDPNP